MLKVDLSCVDTRMRTKQLAKGKQRPSNRAEFVRRIGPRVFRERRLSRKGERIRAVSESDRLAESREKICRANFTLPARVVSTFPRRFRVAKL